MSGMTFTGNFLYNFSKFFNANSVKTIDESLELIFKGTPFNLYGKEFLIISI
jgi:hypothetical protein